MNSNCQPAMLYFCPSILTIVLLSRVSNDRLFTLVIMLHVYVTEGSLSPIAANNFAIQIHNYVRNYSLAILEL